MLKKPPGIEDIFPDRITKWNHILNTAVDIFTMFNYREIIIPVMEFTEVFARGIGTDTDIVSKEMFTFEDRGGRSLALRPEGTASVVRAYVENGEYNRLSTCKFFYRGQMFRAERPQRGRLRQFNQFGAEMFGSSDPYYDHEVMLMMDLISKRLNINNYTLSINSIGCRECRKNYVKVLKEYYKPLLHRLCKDCAGRFDKNPLRILDCKKESCSELKDGAPHITDYICSDCGNHHMRVLDYLENSGVEYAEDPLLVRGLDYYTKTTFEFTTDRLGAQNAFAAGGRYDNLVELFGGKATPAVGFASGVERLFLLTDEKKEDIGIDYFLIHSGGETLKTVTGMIPKITSFNLSVDIDPEKTGFKPQFKKANRENAKYALIIGSDELASGKFIVKDMSTGEQEIYELDKFDAYLKSRIKN